MFEKRQNAWRRILVVLLWLAGLGCAFLPAVKARAQIEELPRQQTGPTDDRMRLQELQEQVAQLRAELAQLRAAQELGQAPGSLGDSFPTPPAELAGPQLSSPLEQSRPPAEGTGQPQGPPLPAVTWHPQRVDWLPEPQAFQDLRVLGVAPSVGQPYGPMFVQPQIFPLVPYGPRRPPGGFHDLRGQWGQFGQLGSGGSIGSPPIFVGPGAIK